LKIKARNVLPHCQIFLKPTCRRGAGEGERGSTARLGPLFCPSPHMNKQSDSPLLTPLLPTATLPEAKQRRKNRHGRN